MIAQKSEREEIRDEFLARTTVQSAEGLLQVARALRAPQTSQELLLKETEQKGLPSLLVLLLSMRGKTDAAGEMAFAVYEHLTNHGVSIEWKEIAEADRVWLKGLQRH